MKIGIRKIRESSLPTLRVQDQRIELRADIDRSVELGSGNQYEIPTGFAYAIPSDYEMVIKLSPELTTRNVYMLGQNMCVRSAELGLLLTTKWNYVIAPSQVLGYAVLVKTESIELEPEGQKESR